MGSETTTTQSSTGLDFTSTRTNSTGLERADGLKSLERGRLLPLLPDEITTALIIPRLSWRAIMSSSQLNCAWRAALRSPIVHKLRAQAITPQTIMTISQFDGTISLYDTATRTWHRRLPRIPLDGTATGTWHSRLPRIPLDGTPTSPLRRRLPRIPFDGWNAGGGCVTLQEKLYYLDWGKIHVFDVAGQGRWKECASMKHARSQFACEAFEGKIYVFGGVGAGNTAEVYDPEQDLWSDLAPMLSHRSEHKVVIIGDVFCVHMGTFFEAGDNCARLDSAQFAEIYDPRTDHWKKVPNFAIDPCNENGASIAEAAVVIGGRLHGIRDDWLYVYEEPLNGSRKTSERLRWDGSGSWKAVQPISWDVFTFHPKKPFGNRYARHTVAISNYGELFAVVCRVWTDSNGCNHRRQWTFVESKGLGAVGQTLTWQIIPGGGTRPGGSLAFPTAPCILSVAGPW